MRPTPWYQSLSLVPKMVQTYPGAKVTELVPNRAGAETTRERKQGVARRDAIKVERLDRSGLE